MPGSFGINNKDTLNLSNDIEKCFLFSLEQARSQDRHSLTAVSLTLMIIRFNSLRIIFFRSFTLMWKFANSDFEMKSEIFSKSVFKVLFFLTNVHLNTP